MNIAYFVFFRRGLTGQELTSWTMLADQKSQYWECKNWATMPSLFTGLNLGPHAQKQAL